MGLLTLEIICARNLIFRFWCWKIGKKFLGNLTIILLSGNNEKMVKFKLITDDLSPIDCWKE